MQPGHRFRAIAAQDATGARRRPRPQRHESKKRKANAGWQPALQPKANAGWQPALEPKANAGWQPALQPKANAGWQPALQPKANGQP